MWEREAAKHSPLLPVSVDAGELFRQFLPSKSLTVHAKGIQIRYRHYWHPMLAARIGQRVEISWDERTIQHIYADLDGRYVELPVVGGYPDVWEADWEAARAGVRALGRAYQADGGRAATARAVARSEEHTSELQSLMRTSYAVFCLKYTKIRRLLSGAICRACTRRIHVQSLTPLP